MKKNKNKDFNKLILKKVIHLQSETEIILNVLENFIRKNKNLTFSVQNILKKRGVLHEQKNIKKD
ncbi:MAG: hypothetical protein ACLVH8_04395 [Fusobacterium sp.]